MFNARTRLAIASAAAATSVVIGMSTPAIAPTAAAATVGKQCPGGVLDDCYSKSEMDQFLDVAAGLVEKYFDQFTLNGRPIPHPDEIVYIPTGSTTSTGCTGDGTVGDSAFLYCPADNTIYVGQEALWGYYHDQGAASAVVGLAHEYGHFIQDIVQIPEPRTLDQNIRHENQADCIAGAWTNFINTDGELEYRKDLTNIGEFLVVIGSKEGPGRDHGTPAERQESFSIGFSGQLQACDAFYPATPLAS